jgi:hypothetical protein
VSSLADIVCRYGAEYLKKHDQQILPSHRKVMRRIASCRTPAMGGRKYVCDTCGKVHYSYHSCRDRHCPKCQNDRVSAWLEKQAALLLPVHYFMVTPTVPGALRPVFRSHQKKMYHLFFKAAAESILCLAKDKRFLGAEIGMMGVLQTWTRQLAYHPHIHFLVPGGGIRNDRWKYAKPDFFIHGNPLACMIRGKFRYFLKQEGLLYLVPKDVWKTEWVCDVKAVGSGEAVLKYLAPYVYRIGISDRNILSLSNGNVTFRYKKRNSKSFDTCTLPALEFLRRYLQHVLPRGFVKVRYFGFLATKKRQHPDHVKELIGKRLSCKSSPHPAKPKKPMTCPDCGHLLIFISFIPKERGPP